MKKTIRRPGGAYDSPSSAKVAARRHASERPADHFAAKFGKLLPWAVVSFLLVVIAIVFGQSLTFGFLDYDDHLYVRGCREVRAGLTGNSIVWAFTNGPVGEWYPLSMISHMLDVQLFGLNAGGHHLTNVLLHAATAVGLFFLFRSMTGEMWPSAFVATVFAIHPQHVESVAWIAERRDVLSGLFFVLTLAAYVGYVRSSQGRAIGWYVLVAAMLSMGLMAKPMLVTVPALLLLLDFWPLGRLGHAADLPECSAGIAQPSIWRLVVEKLPLLAIALAAAAITMATHTPQSKALAPTWPERLSGAAVAAATYVVQFFYPADLAVFYPPPSGGYPAWKVVGATAAVLILSAGVTLGRRRFPAGFVGWFWYLGMLTPVLGLVTISNHMMADRYTYLPGIGLPLVLAWGAARLGAGSSDGRWALAGGAALLIAALVGCATWQTSFWRSDMLLWKHALATTEDNPEAEKNLASQLEAAGRLDEAIARYRWAAQRRADPTLFNNLGVALAKQGKLDEAEAQFLAAIKLDPKFAEPQANMGNVLALQGQTQAAISYYLRSIELDSTFSLPQFKLATLLAAKGKNAEAIPYFERVIELDPDHVRARLGLAAALTEQGQNERAIAEYQRILQIAPDTAPAREALERLLRARSGAPAP